MKNARAELKEFEKHKNKFLTFLQEYVKDTNIPLEDRWNLFVEAGKSGIIKEDLFYHKPDGIDWKVNTLYDTFYIEKYESVKVDKLLEKSIENEIIIKGSKEEDLFKEYFLSNFVYSFKNNW